MSKISELINNSRALGVEPDRILDLILEQEESKKPTKKTKTARKEYPPDFEDWWQQYPDKRNNTKSNAGDEWEKLDASDRLRALQTLVPYRRQLKEPNAPSCIHAERFLKYRRFDSFDGPQLALVADALILSQNNPAHVFLLECIKDGASDGDVRYWSTGRLQIHNHEGKKICVVEREMGDLDQAFGKTVKRLGYSIWTRELFERRTG